MKRCRDCKWCWPESVPINWEDDDADPFDGPCEDGCLHPLRGQETDCASQRQIPWPFDSIGGYCGRRGRWFERRDSVTVDPSQ